MQAELFASDGSSSLAHLTLADASKSRADDISLHFSPAWRAQLFYVDRVVRRRSSLIDSPEFFFAKNGKSDLRAELHASVDAIFLPPNPQKPDDHALCKFPRRSAWLIENLQIDRKLIPTIYCRELDQFLQRQSVKGISLVFASYYLNNPASMFGHTFLRLHRGKGPGQGEPNALLDSAVNFAANPTTTNALLYSWLGMTGGFPGTFSLMPYYLKVQEYNNSESRDLWEYPLNLSQQQVDNLMLTLWELGPVQIDYWYIDENCSYILLVLLETTNPGMNLASSFNVMATPADTVRAVTATQQFSGTVKYRPSALSTYLQREKALNSSELEKFKQLIARDEINIDEIFSGIDDGKRAQILDAALDYIDFDEGVAGNRLPEIQKQRRIDLLKIRSNIRIPPLPLQEIPEKERPDRGHWSMRVGFSLGEVQTKANKYQLVDFDWRPTLHDLGTPSSGYSANLQLKMLEFKFRHYNSSTRKVTRLESAKWFDVLSVPSLGRVKTPLAWRLAIDSQPDRMIDALGDDCYRHSMVGGAGVAAGSSSAKLYMISLIRASLSCRGREGSQVALGGILGFLSEVNDAMKISLNGIWWRSFQINDRNVLVRWRRESEAKFTYIYSDSHEMGLFVKTDDESRSIGGMSYGFYF